MKTINIDGVEYALVPVGKLEPEVEIHIIRSEARTIESDKYVFEAVRLEKSDAPGTYLMVLILTLQTSEKGLGRKSTWIIMLGW